MGVCEGQNSHDRTSRNWCSILVVGEKSVPLFSRMGVSSDTWLFFATTMLWYIAYRSRRCFRATTDVFLDQVDWFSSCPTSVSVPQRSMVVVSSVAMNDVP